LLPPLLLLLATPAALVHLSIKVKLTSKALHQQTVMGRLCTGPGSGILRCLGRCCLVVLCHAAGEIRCFMHKEPAGIMCDHDTKPPVRG
jgi:hypothetical protein